MSLETNHVYKVFHQWIDILEPQNRVVRDVYDWQLCLAMVCVHTQQKGQLRIYLNPVF